MHQTDSAAEDRCIATFTRRTPILGRPRSRRLFGLLGLLVMAACGAAAGTPPEAALAATASAVTVSIKGFAFLPQTVTVVAGTTVTWKNLDGEPHTVRGADEQIRSSALDQDDIYSVKFDKPGTYRYGCSIHPKMSGTIVVQ